MNLAQNYIAPTTTPMQPPISQACDSTAPAAVMDLRAVMGMSGPRTTMNQSRKIQQSMLLTIRTPDDRRVDAQVNSNTPVGRTYYLAPDGNDNGTGSISDPWLTLDRA